MPFWKKAASYFNMNRIFQSGSPVTEYIDYFYEMVIRENFRMRNYGKVEFRI